MAEKLVAPLRYENGNDVSMRLDGTYLRYKGAVVHCSYTGDLSVTLSPVVTSPQVTKSVIVHSSNVDLDISSIPLGFFASPKMFAPLVFKRRPVRRYKQGVCLNNIEAAQYAVSERHRFYLRDRDIQSYLTSAGFHLMLANKYPSVEAAIKYVVSNKNPDGYASAAISLDLCFFSIGSVIALIDSSFEEVGRYNLETKSIEVNEWWKTPTMMDRLRDMGVPLKE